MYNLVLLLLILPFKKKVDSLPSQLCLSQENSRLKE